MTKDIITNYFRFGKFKGHLFTDVAAHAPWYYVWAGNQGIVPKDDLWKAACKLLAEQREAEMLDSCLHSDWGDRD